MADTLVIDGSHGEGGGQILRSALSLSLLTGRAMRIDSIRAHRPRPGLMPQHLKSVEAAASVAAASVSGAELGSRALVFKPGRIRAGTYQFDIGSAGAVSLVFQTIALPLGLASSPSRVTLSGGTHVPWSPCVHYLQHQWLYHLSPAGLSAAVELERAGYYPRGGGLVSATIEPSAGIDPLEISERGRLRDIWGISAVSNLDASVAERQRTRALERLTSLEVNKTIDLAQLPSYGRGTMLLLVARFEHSQCCYFALGARGKRAETVADEAVDALETFLATEGAVDEYLADQLILPLAFAAGTSRIKTASVTRHLLTNAWVLEQFFPERVTVNGVVAAAADSHIGRAGLVCIEGRPYAL